MRKPAVFLTSAIAIVSAMSPIGTGTAAGDPAGGTQVPLNATLRNCDFSSHTNHPYWGLPSNGQGMAVIRRSGNTVIADVQFADSREIGFHYDVGLIQAPRPASSGCGPGAPDTAYVGTDVGPDGRAAVTVQDTIRSGTTGAWVIIQRLSPRSQDPAEYYSSTFIAPV